MGDVIRIGVSGALGRMGQVLETLTADRADMALAARIDRPGPSTVSALLNPQEALGLCDVIIDFSTAAASTELATLAGAVGGPAIVIGATGFTAEQEAEIAAAAAKIAIVKSGNFSLGVNLLALLVEEAARRLGPEAWDVEILEAHHRRKVDAPSGTAVLLGRAAARGRGEGPETARAPEHSGPSGARPQGSVGYASIRGGGIVGEHSVIFAAEDEIITLSHSARDRSLFARGALAAAAWVVTAPPGLYGMRDVLGV